MRLTQQQLENHLWGAANMLRGKTAGQDYKNYILSLMFYKRLYAQWENEVEETIERLEKEAGRTFSDGQRAITRARDDHRLNIPDGARRGDVLAVSTDIGKTLTEAMRAVSAANDELRGSSPWTGTSRRQTAAARSSSPTKWSTRWSSTSTRWTSPTGAKQDDLRRRHHRRRAA
jgi:type I restriction enzyme M protein